MQAWSPGFGAGYPKKLCSFYPKRFSKPNWYHPDSLGQNPPGAAAAVADPEPGPAPQAPRNSSAPARSQPPAQPLYLKALTIPLFQPVPPASLQPLVPARSCVHLDSGHIPLILNPIVSTLPVLSSPTSCVNASVGKSKKSGKYICKHCGRDCLKPSVLEKHIRSHTGERPFPCTTCGIAFKTQSNLYKHRRTQTHVNNTRLPSEPDISGGAEQNERPAEKYFPLLSKIYLCTTGEMQANVFPLSSYPVLHNNRHCACYSEQLLACCGGSEDGA
uniref:C2H2-type domain-containing protein n=1 Tax=Malurus cyaneus samueli TaxID=2593467 RepID=A0A8C5TTP0_9PASS